MVSLLLRLIPATLAGLPGAPPESPPELRSPTSVVPADDGDERNIARKLQAADQAQRDAVLTFDRPIGDAIRGWRLKLREQAGIDLALESTTIFQVTSGSRGPNTAAEHTGGIFGTWTMWRDPDTNDRFGIGAAAETRGNFSGDSFRDMTSAIGSLWSPNDSTSDSYDKITQLWFGTQFASGKLFLIAGKIDPGSYTNGNRFAGNGNTQFFSQPFATNPARAFPDNGIGAIGRYAPVKWLHVQLLASDSDAVSEHPPFETMDGHWFLASELAFKPDFKGLGQGTYRMMLYTRDLEPEDSQGWALSFDQNLGEDLGLFFRYGSNEGDVLPVERIAAAGISFLTPFGRPDDEAGVGIAWTRPSDDSLREEYNVETYYRLPLTDLTDLSGSVMLLADPAARREDVIAVFGVRLRVIF